MISRLLGASVLSSLLIAPAYAQFVAPPTDLTTTNGYLDIPVRWKEVPDGICELTPGVKSYSGYVDVFEDQHVFWWFFESRNSPSTDPLTVWFNGGPGASSMSNLFQELGPCGIDSTGAVYNNPYAWNRASNVLFIDHPSQVGFSYSTPIPGYVRSHGIIQLPDATCPDYAGRTCGTYSYPNLTDTANSTTDAAPSMWRTLQGFMGAFPQYSRSHVSLATESYGGHYAPIFSAYIETQNVRIRDSSLPGAHHIGLASLLVVNGWFDPLVQFQAHYNFTVFPGNTYDFDPYNQSVKNQVYNSMYGPGNCYDRLLDCNTRGINEICTAADGFCGFEVENVFDIVTGRDQADIRELMPDPFPPPFFQDYLNIPKVQQAIGAYVNFTQVSRAVHVGFDSTGDDAREEGTIAALRNLVKQGVYVVLVYGDADYNCNWLGGQVVSNLVDAPGFSSAGYQNITTADNIVHGQAKQADNFAFVRVYHSGHYVPFYQPLLALELFERAIHGQDVATGAVSCVQDGGNGACKTVGTAESTYREGSGTI